MRQVISDKPRGFRDVHWCDVNNEPVILEWRTVDGKEVRHCPDCTEGNVPELHPFCFHILKSARPTENEGTDQ